MYDESTKFDNQNFPYNHFVIFTYHIFIPYVFRGWLSYLRYCLSPDPSTWLITICVSFLLSPLPHFQIQFCNTPIRFSFVPHARRRPVLLKINMIRVDAPAVAAGSNQHGIVHRRGLTVQPVCPIPDLRGDIDSPGASAGTLNRQPFQGLCVRPPLQSPSPAICFVCVLVCLYVCGFFLVSFVMWFPCCRRRRRVRSNMCGIYPSICFVFMRLFPSHSIAHGFVVGYSWVVCFNVGFVRLWRTHVLHGSLFLWSSF